MDTHRVDCDLDEDCTCEVSEEPPLCPDCGERHYPPVVVQSGMMTMVMPRWAAEMLGIEPEVQLEHPEYGHLEI